MTSAAITALYGPPKETLLRCTVILFQSVRVNVEKHVWVLVEASFSTACERVKDGVAVAVMKKECGVTSRRTINSWIIVYNY